MNNEKIEKYLYSITKLSTSFSIKRIKKFSKKLKNPHNKFPSIHVAGTNGKGSVCSFLDSIYRSAGYKVGLYTSPHLKCITERIKINGVNICKNKIIQYANEFLCIEKDLNLTFFEILTVIAFYEFYNQKIDIAIIEVGLGGKYDATNIINPDLAIITSISKDHMDILGSSISKIARAKAGIIKNQKPLVIGQIPIKALKVINSIAKSKNAPVFCVKKDYNLVTAFNESCQIINKSIASLAIDLLIEKFPVSNISKQRGLKSAICRGRWEKIKLLNGKELILDSSHNEDSAKFLTKSLLKLKKIKNQKFTFICATSGIDRARIILKTIIPFAKEIILTQTCHHNSTDPKIFLEFLPKNINYCIKPIDQLFKKNLCLIENSSNLIIATGSIYLVGSILRFIEDVI